VKPKGSLLCSQKAIGPYSEPDKTSPHPPIYFFMTSFNIIHLGLDLPSGLHPTRFPAKTFYAFLLPPIHPTCLAHLVLLDLTMLIIFGGK
jgi:hypothetical protein